MWPRDDDQELINALTSFVQSDPIKSEEPGVSTITLESEHFVACIADRMIDHRIAS